jgi:hypothetical protein
MVPRLSMTNIMSSCMPTEAKNGSTHGLEWRNRPGGDLLVLTAAQDQAASIRIGVPGKSGARGFTGIVVP